MRVGGNVGEIHDCVIVPSMRIVGMLSAGIHPSVVAVAAAAAPLKSSTVRLERFGNPGESLPSGRRAATSDGRTFVDTLDGLLGRLEGRLRRSLLFSFVKKFESGERDRLHR